VLLSAAPSRGDPTKRRESSTSRTTTSTSDHPLASPPTDAEVESAVTSLIKVMSVEEKARQLVIEDAIGCCVSNGYFNQSKADAFFGALGGGVLDSAGRNVDPHLMNQIQVGLC
jgi:hypothetical protein